MIPGGPTAEADKLDTPRMSGDDPWEELDEEEQEEYSPHERG